MKKAQTQQHFEAVYNSLVEEGDMQTVFFNVLVIIHFKNNPIS